MLRVAFDLWFVHSLFCKRLLTNTHKNIARATTEAPNGMSASTTSQQFEAAAARTPTKGFGAAGFSLLQEITKLLPSITSYPVNYPVSTCLALNNSGLTEDSRRIGLVAQQKIRE